ncbi:MAG TPA: hypothetical protein VMU05_25300 [Dongiaceae bacterium]|nr:hypothetical protein [Dongiaceae bacterium]
METLYRKGALRKRENPNASIANIANCDSRTGFLIDFKTHEYRTYKVVKYTTMAQIEEYLNKNPQNAVNIESTTVDTGEQRMFFGHRARHFITTTKRAPDKNNPGGEEIVDAWYIDHELPDNYCAPEYVRTEPFYVLGTALVTPPQVPRLHHTGPVPTGLPVKRTATHKTLSANGAPDRTITTIETIEEISDSLLDPSLFDLPAGSRENPDLLKRK